ncbi:MAG TPA: hypothetical protein VFG20_15410 [Planctomycetaceae bacterium]|nr:hypothetical protein [Planctomycetaceae bacterium]
MPPVTMTPQSECPRCQLNTVDGGEVFYHRKRTFKFDVDLALQIVSDGREPVEVDDESLRKTLRKTEVCEEHLPHVHLGRPGILAHVTYHLEDGRTVIAHVLIDGNHRAARSLRDGIPFRVYLLNEEETARTLLRAPEKIAVPRRSLARR